MRYVVVALAIVTGACSGQREDAEPFTLYRNSALERSLRVHWATFDADESDPAYNRNNCEMAARLLNANMAEWARSANGEPHPHQGFWCERGDYSEQGTVPTRFDAEFPTDVPEQYSAPA